MTPRIQREVSLLFLSIALVACGGFGRVNQGQVVEYRRGEGLVTLIGDANYRDPANPRFTVLPPVTIRVPEDAREMGPDPEAGKLLLVDWRNRSLMVFDAAAQRIHTIPYTLVEEHNEVAPGDPRVKGVRLPVVDRERKTVTLYSPRDRKLLVISPGQECFALPEDTWKAGDEIRYYYRNPGRALRLMNVSRTDLNKAGK